MAIQELGPRLVLHADDFGMCPAITDGILDGFERGLLTSTSVLANAPDAARALAAWKRLGEHRRGSHLASCPQRRRLGDPLCDFDLGVHLNLTQGRPLSGERFPAELLDGEGRFPGISVLLRRLRRAGGSLAAAVEAELEEQIQFVLDHGQRPSHLNGHQYVEHVPLVGRIVASLLARFRIGAVRVALETCWLRSLGWPGIGLGAWLGGGVRWYYARRWRACLAARGLVHFSARHRDFHAQRDPKTWTCPPIRSEVARPDAFFGSLSAGRVTLGQIRAFLSAARPFRTAEIVLHPGQPVPEAPQEAGDPWYDPWSDRRPQELQLLLSAELAECLEQTHVRLGRMA